MFYLFFYLLRFSPVLDCSGAQKNIWGSLKKNSVFFSPTAPWENLKVKDAAADNREDLQKDPGSLMKQDKHRKKYLSLTSETYFQTKTPCRTRIKPFIPLLLLTRWK